MTDGSGATTCINESGSSSDEDKKMDCPKGTKYVTEDKYGSGCRPECRPGSYSSTGLYPCTRCEEGTYTKESGATACTEYPKECSEGYKLIDHRRHHDRVQARVCEGLLLRSGVYPCKACEARLYYHTERGSTACVQNANDNNNNNNNNDDDNKDDKKEESRGNRVD